MKTQHRISILKGIKDLFFKTKNISHIVVSLIVLYSLLSCNSDRKSKITRGNSSISKNDDIDNDGIPNEFDVDYMEGLQIKKTAENKEVKRDFEYALEEQERINIVPTDVKQKKKQPKIKKRTKGFKIKKQPTGSVFNIPDTPLRISLKRDMQLLADGKKQLKDIRKHFCNVNQIIEVNGNKRTLSEFSRSIKGKRIKIKKFHIELENKGCVKHVVLEYKVEFLFKSLRDKPYRLTKVSKNIGFN